MGEIFRMVQRNQENAGKVEDKGRGKAGQERAGGGEWKGGEDREGTEGGREEKGL